MAIPVFVNRTPYTGMETSFTNDLRNQFAKSKVARVVSEIRAPATIKGTVQHIDVVREGAIDANKTEDNTLGNEGLPANTVLTTEYRVLVRLRVELISKIDGKKIWEGDFTGERTYTAPQIRANNLNSANALYNQNAREMVVAEISKDVMAEAHDRMSENF